MMRTAALVTLLVLALALGERAASASSQAGPPPESSMVALQDGGDGGDDVVEVQLAVLGIVAGVVFVVGSGAYLLRRRLGLTAYAPPKDSGHH